MGVDDRWGPVGLQKLRELYEPTRRFAAVIGRWDVEPDDLVQEAFAKVLARPEADIDDLGPYLRRTVVNLATDERRRGKKRSEIVQQMRPDAGTADTYPSELAELMRLPEKMRALLYLVEVDGMSTAEAGALVGMSGSASRVALMRARRRLKLELSVESSGE